MWGAVWWMRTLRVGVEVEGAACDARKGSDLRGCGIFARGKAMAFVVVLQVDFMDVGR